MGKRCEDINCPYLAQDGSCLLDEGLLKESCPALEKVEHERKDDWIREVIKRKSTKVSPYKGKE